MKITMISLEEGIDNGEGEGGVSPPLELNLDQSDLGIIERNASAHWVEHAGIFEVWVYPHGCIGMDARCPSWITFDNLSIDQPHPPHRLPSGRSQERRSPLPA